MLGGFYYYRCYRLIQKMSLKQDNELNVIQKVEIMNNYVTNEQKNILNEVCVIIEESKNLKKKNADLEARLAKAEQTIARFEKMREGILNRLEASIERTNKVDAKAVTKDAEVDTEKNEAGIEMIKKLLGVVPY